MSSMFGKFTAPWAQSSTDGRVVTSLLAAGRDTRDLLKSCNCPRNPFLSKPSHTAQCDIMAANEALITYKASMVLKESQRAEPEVQRAKRLARTVTTFAASQRAAQRLGLKTATRSMDAIVEPKADLIADQNVKALDVILMNVETPLTPELLCLVHRVLCDGLIKPIQAPVNPFAARNPFTRGPQSTDRENDLTDDDAERVGFRVGLPRPSGILRTTKVRVGQRRCCEPSLLPENLRLLVQELNVLFKNNTVDVYVKAAAAIAGILEIHPFPDGNGRLARIVGNWVLAREGLPFVVDICARSRIEYVQSLRSIYAGEAGALGRFALQIAAVVADAWAQLDHMVRAEEPAPTDPTRKPAAAASGGFGSAMTTSTATAAAGGWGTPATTSAGGWTYANPSTAAAAAGSAGGGSAPKAGGWGTGSDAFGAGSTSTLTKANTTTVNPGVKSTTPADRDAIIKRAREEWRAGQCMVCLDEAPTVALLCCGALVHLGCIQRWIGTSNGTCPQCRKNLTQAAGERRAAAAASASAPPARAFVDEDALTQLLTGALMQSLGVNMLPPNPRGRSQGPARARSQTRRTASVAAPRGSSPRARSNRRGRSQSVAAPVVHCQQCQSNRAALQCDVQRCGACCMGCTYHPHRDPDACDDCRTRMAARDCPHHKCGTCCVAAQIACSRHTPWLLESDSPTDDDDTSETGEEEDRTCRCCSERLYANACVHLLCATCCGQQITYCARHDQCDDTSEVPEEDEYCASCRSNKKSQRCDHGKCGRCCRDENYGCSMHS
jgi:hypothetical protein